MSVTCAMCNTVVDEDNADEIGERLVCSAVCFELAAVTISLTQERKKRATLLRRKLEDAWRLGFQASGSPRDFDELLREDIDRVEKMP